jgi:arsenate reductase (thioredoxin)
MISRVDDALGAGRPSQLSEGNVGRSYKSESRHLQAAVYLPGGHFVPSKTRFMTFAGPLQLDIAWENRRIKVYLGKVLFQYLITVCANAEKSCPTVWPGVSHRLHWLFEDPAVFEGSEEESLAKFREVRDQIERKVKDWVAEQSGTPAAG